MENAVWSNIFGPPRDRQDTIALLQSLPIFAGFSTSDLVQVDRRLHERLYKAGDVVFEEGMPGAGLYIVKTGEIVIRKKMDGGGSLELSLIGEGSFFGEMALLDDMPRSAGAFAVRDSVLLAFCQPDLASLKDRNPRLALKLVSNVAGLICRRLVRTNDHLERLQRQLDSLAHSTDAGGRPDGTR